MRELDTTILGGLPVTVRFTIAKAEPDIGIFYPYVDDWHIAYIGSRPLKNDAFLRKRLTGAQVEELLHEMENYDA